MKNHFYYLFLAPAIVCFGFANKSYGADSGYDLSGVTSASGPSTTGSANIGTAAQGTGNLVLRNTNVPFSDYGTTYDKAPNGKAYDGLPIEQMNALVNGQKIFDQYAANYSEAPPAAGTLNAGTQSQSPTGRAGGITPVPYMSVNGTDLSTGDPILVHSGLPPTTTALQAGAAPTGGYYYTKISSETKPRFTFGMNTVPTQSYYTSTHYPQLPPTSLGSVDINVYTTPAGKVNAKADTIDFAP